MEPSFLRSCFPNLTSPLASCYSWRLIQSSQLGYARLDGKPER